MNATAAPVNVTVGNSGRKVHRAYLAANGQASTVCGAERRGVGVTHTRRTDRAIDCLACSPSSAAVVETPAAEEQAPTFAAAYVAPTVETVEPVENVLRIAPTEFSEGGTCDTCELPSHTTCPLVTGCECCEANAEEQIAADAEPEFVKVQTTDGYGTPHMVLRRADLAAAGRAANTSEDVNENATEEQALAIMEEEYDALREEQDGNTPGTPRAAWVADRLNLLAQAMRQSAHRLEQARRANDEVVVDEYPLLGDPSVIVRHYAPAEQDLAPSSTPEQRYEVAGDTTAADLRPGDYVVDSSGVRQYAAFDVAPVDGAHVEVWTAIADQERGLPVRFRLASDWSVRITRRAAVNA